MSAVPKHLLNGHDDFTGRLQIPSSAIQTKFCDLLGGAGAPAKAGESLPAQSLELYAALNRTKQEIARRNSRRCIVQMTALLAGIDRDADDDAASARCW